MPFPKPLGEKIRVGKESLLSRCLEGKIVSVSLGGGDGL